MFPASVSGHEPNDFFLKLEQEAGRVELWAVIDWNDSQVCSICWISVCVCVWGTLREEKGRYSLSKPAVSLPYWCLCHHRLTDWLLDEHPPDWCDRQLAWCSNPPPKSPPPQNLPSSHHTQSLPLSHSRSRLDSECEQCVFTAATLETDCKTFRGWRGGVGVYPTGGLASVADWCSWSNDEKGPKRHFWWIQAATEPVGNVINEQLSAHFKVHACWCTWTLTKTVKTLSGLILLKAFKWSSLVSWLMNS